MRSILILALFTGGLANSAWAGFSEVRDLALDTQGIETLNIKAGAGTLSVVGDSAASEIKVTATIYIPNDSERALKRSKREMTLSLTQNGADATLRAYFDESIWRWGRKNRINLEVSVPEGLHLSIVDGVGSIEIRNVAGDLKVRDGTGSLTMNDVGGNVKINDGTGSITVSAVGGDISVRDGTGGIDIRDVAGSVTVHDGAGGINVAGVEKELNIIEQGSGRLRYSDINGHVHRGYVQQET